MKRCNTCNAEFSFWESVPEGGEKVERCPVCNNTKQMSDAVDEFRGQTETDKRSCDFCGQDYSFKGTKANVCPTCKENALRDSEYLLSRTDVAEKIARQTTPLYPHPFQTITDELFALYLRKNHDYGNSFSDQFQELGMASSIIRLSDKLSRLKSLHSKAQQVADESIRDTLVDLANYAIMTVMELDRESKK